jgi:hypothetical protein
MSAVLPSKFDINKLTFEVLKPIPAQKDTITGNVIGTSKKQIFMKYAGDTLRFQTPIAITPFGISKPFEDNAGEKEWIIDMDIDKINKTGIEGAEHLPENSVLEKRLTEFKNVLRQIDDKCCDHISKIFKDLWPSKKNAKTKENVQEDTYESLIKVNKHPEKGDFPDKFRAKFSRPYINKDGKKSFSVFDSHGKEINWYNDKCQSPTEAPFNMKYMLVQAIVQCSGLWIIGEKIYCSFKVLQIRTWKPSTVTGFGFVIEDGETLQEEEEESPAVESPAVESPAVESPVSKKQTDDLEDESEYSDEEDHQ